MIVYQSYTSTNYESSLSTILNLESSGWIYHGKFSGSDNFTHPLFKLWNNRYKEKLPMRIVEHIKTYNDYHLLTRECL